MKIRCGETVREISVEAAAATVDGSRHAVVPLRQGEQVVGLEVDGVRTPVRIVRQGERALVWCSGSVWEFASGRAPGRRAGSDHAGDLLAPMPGRVRRALVSAGQEVSRGEVVMILEAMKMEHAIRAPHDGVVARVAHREGDLVEAGVALVELTARPPAAPKEP